jgi:hypothetical protein
VRAEEALVVPELEPDLRLLLDQAPDLLVREQGPDLVLVVALDDEVLVELGRVPDLDVLHTQHLAHLAESRLAVDPEAELLAADEGGPDPGEGLVDVARRDRVGVQGNRPVLELGLDLVPLPESSLDEVGADPGAKLLPDFLTARTQDTFKKAHLDPPPCAPLRALQLEHGWAGGRLTILCRRP